MIKDIVNWYLRYYGSNCWCNQFLIAFNGSVDKADVLLIGDSKLHRDCHAYYLWRFKKNWLFRDEILKRINRTKIWNSSFMSLYDFEQLYAYVWDIINTPKIPQIDQLIIYDIALRLACLEGTGRLMPKDYVYVHALPRWAWKNLLKNGIISGYKINIGKADYNTIPTVFKSLNACQFEDMLCCLGKSLRRVKNKHTSRIQQEIEIDNIVKKYIKTIY